MCVLCAISNRSNHSGQITLKENAPDTITTFITTAFAINKKQGIGFTPKPVEVCQYIIILQKSKSISGGVIRDGINLYTDNNIQSLLVTDYIK